MGQAPGAQDAPGQTGPSGLEDYGRSYPRERVGDKPGAIHYNPATGDVIFWGQRFNIQEIVDEVSGLLPRVEREAAKPHRED